MPDAVKRSILSWFQEENVVHSSQKEVKPLNESRSGVTGMMSDSASQKATEEVELLTPESLINSMPSSAKGSAELMASHAVDIHDSDQTEVMSVFRTSTHSNSSNLKPRNKPIWTVGDDQAEIMSVISSSPQSNILKRKEIASDPKPISKSASDSLVGYLAKPSDFTSPSKNPIVEKPESTGRIDSSMQVDRSTEGMKPNSNESGSMMSLAQSDSYLRDFAINKGYTDNEIDTVLASAQGPLRTSEFLKALVTLRQIMRSPEPGCATLSSKLVVDLPEPSNLTLGKVASESVMNKSHPVEEILNGNSPHFKPKPDKLTEKRQTSQDGDMKVENFMG